MYERNQMMLREDRSNAMMGYQAGRVNIPSQPETRRIRVVADHGRHPLIVLFVTALTIGGAVFYFEKGYARLPCRDRHHYRIEYAGVQFRQWRHYGRAGAGIFIYTDNDHSIGRSA